MIALLLALTLAFTAGIAIGLLIAAWLIGTGRPSEIEQEVAYRHALARLSNSNGHNVERRRVR